MTIPSHIGDLPDRDGYESAAMYSREAKTRAAIQDQTTIHLFVLGKTVTPCGLLPDYWQDGRTIKTASIDHASFLNCPTCRAAAGYAINFPEVTRGYARPVAVSWPDVPLAGTVDAPDYLKDPHHD